jgi:hypothetical protein
MQGEQESCAKLGCQTLWHPDRQEQRFCWLCKKWYHTGCLGAPSDVSQETYIKMVAGSEEYKNIPPAILAVAFQPTARGGLAHFIAGNIRIVSEATALLQANSRNDVENSSWIVAHLVEESRVEVQDDDWLAWLKFVLGLDKDRVEEELIVQGQCLYSCPTCDYESSLI